MFLFTIAAFTSLRQSQKLINILTALNASKNDWPTYLIITLLGNDSYTYITKIICKKILNVEVQYDYAELI